MLKTWVLKLKEEVTFLEMSILYTSNVFATHFIENTHFRNNLSKQSVPLCFFSIYFGSLSFTIYLYFVVCLCKLSKYRNYLQNFRELTNVLFIFYSSPLFFHNSIKVCYKEQFFKKYTKNLVTQLQFLVLSTQISKIQITYLISNDNY